MEYVFEYNDKWDNAIKIMETFKINFSNHIRSGWLVILGVLICVNFPGILSFLDPGQRYEDSIFVGITVFVLFVLPAIIIHVNYYLVNKGDVLKYSPERKELSIIHKDRLNTFNLDDIDRVERSMSFNEAANRSSVLPWDGYNHSVIYLKDGEVFTITSLLVTNLELPIEAGKIVIKKNIYRLAKIR